MLKYLADNLDKRSEH